MWSMRSWTVVLSLFMKGRGPLGFRIGMRRGVFLAVVDYFVCDRDCIHLRHLGCLRAVSERETSGVVGARLCDQVSMYGSSVGNPAPKWMDE